MKTNLKIIALLMLIVTSFGCSKNDDNQQPVTIIISDTNFEQALIDLGHDTNGLTGDILKTDAETVTHLHLVSKNISDLTGIEGFINLETLNCSENNLTSLNLSNNSKLKELICSLNQISNLDVSHNLDLEKLNCGANQLTSLDLSNNTKLIEVTCAVNQLESLNIKNENNTSIDIFSATNNPNLNCIKADNAIYSNSNWTSIDAQTGFSESCGEPINIPDANFEQALIDLDIDTNGLNGNISKTDAEIVTSLDVSNKNISSIQGIEGFINLRKLICDNNDLISLNISNNTLLERLDCADNNLTNLDINNNLVLEDLLCDNNDLTSLDVSNNTALEQLIVHHNVLTSLDVSNNTALVKLNCFNNQIESLDLSNNTALTYMACAVNLLTSLNIKNGNNTTINHFQAKNNPNLTCVQVDDVEYSISNWADKVDNLDSYSTDCN